jgi:hypothetical protein
VGTFRGGEKRKRVGNSTGKKLEGITYWAQ